MMAAQPIDPPAPELPRNIEAEAALLGALMIESRLCDRIGDKLEAAHFFEPLHGRIYEAILAEHNQGKRPSPVSLKPYFAEDAAMRELGGSGYLAQLTGSGANVIGAMGFADQILELARRRALIASLGEISGDARNWERPFAELVAEAEAAINEAGRDTADGARELSAGQAADLAIKSGEDEQERGVLCGIEAVDCVMGPIRRRKVAIVAGRPGMGKSALAGSYAIGAAQRGHGVLIFSLEMDAEALAARMLSDLTFDGQGKPVPYELIESGKLHVRDDIRRVLAARDRLAELPIEIVDMGQCTTARMNSMIRRWARRFKARGHRLELVIVDYLQLLQSAKRTRDRIELVTEVSQDIRRAAKANGVGLMALAQLSRKVEDRPDKRPIMSDLRESGQIEADADLILFLYRAEYYLAQTEPPESGEVKKAEERAKWERGMELCRGQIEFICAKRRQGKTGKAFGLFHGAFGAVRG